MIPVPTGLALLMSILVVQGRPGANDQPYAPVATDIAIVQSGGLWEVGKRWGRYRAVVRRGCSPEHCYDDLFVEWLEEGEGRARKVVGTKHIREIPGLTHVSEVRFVYAKKVTRLQVRHEGGDGADKWTLCFQLGGPTEYQAKQGPCERAG